MSGETLPPMIVLSSDGVEFLMEMKLINQSETLKHLVQNFGYDIPGARILPITAENVNAETMKKVIKWMERYSEKAEKKEKKKEADAKAELAAALIPGQMRDSRDHLPLIILDEWDREFLRITNSDLFQLVSAANYLDVKTLFDVVCKKIGLMISGKSAEQMRETFNIKSDEQRESERLAAEKAAERAEYGEDDDDESDEYPEEDISLSDDNF